jgi:putative hemolysin
MPILAWQLLLQLVLIVLNGVFASAEIAIISINDNKLAKLALTGDKRAVRLSKLIKQPARFLSTIQVCITLAGFLGSAFAASNFADRIVSWLVSTGVSLPLQTLNTIIVITITLILSYITLVFGELVPKRVAMRKPEQIALAMSGPIFFIAKVINPIIWFLSVSTNGILRLIGIKNPHADDKVVTEEEIRMMVDAGSEKGAINNEKKEIIHNIFLFDDVSAVEIATHRTGIIMLSLDESNEQWETTITESRHSFYPVCGENTDDIIGILSTKDYFRLKEKTRENIMKFSIKPAYFVPETVRADVLFRNMQKKRNHFAVVLDEYGGVSGIVTMNDLLEQLVGKLEDDNTIPEEPPLIEHIDSQTWKIQGVAPLDIVSEELGIELPKDDYDTLGGLVFGLLGTIPDDGSTPELEGYGLKFKVTSIKEHRLESVIVYLNKNSLSENK